MVAMVQGAKFYTKISSFGVKVVNKQTHVSYIMALTKIREYHRQK